MHEEMEADKLLDLLKSWGVKKLRLSGDNVMGCCPLHGENNPSFGVSLKHPHAWNCFGCQRRGSTLTTLAQSLNQKLDATFEIVEHTDMPVAQEDEEQIYPEESLGVFTDIGSRRLSNRGISGKTQEDFEIRQYKNKLIFPVRNSANKIVGLIYNAGGKYIVHKFKKRFYLYGEHLAKHKRVVIVEGMVDTLRMYQFFKKYKLPFSVVGLFGLSLSHLQYLRLRNLGDSFYPMLDNDEAGIQARSKVCDTLLRVTGKVFRVNYSHKDPAECSDEELLKVFAPLLVTPKKFSEIRYLVDKRLANLI